MAEGLEQVATEQEERGRKLNDWWNSHQLEGKEIIEEVYRKFVRQWAQEGKASENYCMAGYEEDGPDQYWYEH